ISRKFGSELANSSTIALTLPAISEANKVNAPITSTTMMLILGDCIAVSLIEARNFSAENFATFHPGGKLGSAFIKVSDIMRKNDLIPICKINQKIPEILFEMTSKHLGCTAVLNEDYEMVGIITDGDLRRHICNNFLELEANQIMTKNPITISENSLASEALSIMKSKAITSIFVVKNQKVLGIIHIHDCINAGL
ncbi:MAG: CBS domain-containing protein, partial [Alphaproteobacteria bacterium]